MDFIIVTNKFYCKYRLRIVLTFFFLCFSIITKRLFQTRCRSFDKTIGFNLVILYHIYSCRSAIMLLCQNEFQFTIHIRGIKFKKIYYNTRLIGTFFPRYSSTAQYSFLETNDVRDISSQRK